MMDLECIVRRVAIAKEGEKSLEGLRTLTMYILCVKVSWKFEEGFDSDGEEHWCIEVWHDSAEYRYRDGSRIGKETDNG